MTQAVTFDDVWKMFQEMVRENRERSAETNREFQEMVRENRERSAELDRRFQDTDREIRDNAREIREIWQQIKDVSAQMQEDTGRKIKEVSAQMLETDRKIKEDSAKVSAQMLETDRKIKEDSAKVSAQMQDTDRKIKEVSMQIGRLGGRLGEFVEGLVAPACETLFAKRGIPVHMVSRQVKAKLDGGRHMEIDLFVVNTSEVSLVEVKSKLTVENVQDHEKKMGEFKEFFPEYAHKKAIGAVAGMVVDESVVRFAIKRGLFVLVQAGDSVRIANDETFVPRAW